MASRAHPQHISLSMPNFGTVLFVPLGIFSTLQKLTFLNWDFRNKIAKNACFLRDCMMQMQRTSTAHGK